MATRLLIADDEAHIRRLIEQTLEELEDQGVEILTANDGEEALEIIRALRPGLVFLDVMMPKMSGFEVCQAVKRKLRLDDVFVVVLTAQGQDTDEGRGELAGADMYMTKPFDPDQILATAKAVLHV